MMMMISVITPVPFDLELPNLDYSDTCGEGCISRGSHSHVPIPTGGAQVSPQCL